MKQTLQSFLIGPIVGAGLTPKVRLAAVSQFQSSTGEVHLAGDSQHNYTEITLTPSGDDYSFPDTIVDTNTDSPDDPNSAYSAWVMNGATEVEELFGGYSFPASQGNSISWTDLKAYNVKKVPLRDDQAYSKIQSDAKYNSSLAPDARTNVAGKGYATKNPLSGAPTFITDDDATSLLTAGAVVRRNSFGGAVVYDAGAQVFDVKAYGAKGDWNGTTGTDDTAAITAALVDCLAVRGRLYLPHGSYLVTGTSEVFNLTKRVEIFGDGAAVSFLIFAPGTGAIPMLRIKPPSTAGYTINAADETGWYLHDFGIASADGVAGGNAIAIDLSAGTDTYLDESVFTRLNLGSGHSYYGIVLLQPQTTPATGFQNSVISDCKINGGIGLVNTSDNIVIENSFIYGEGDIYIFAPPGVYGPTLRDVVVTAKKGITIAGGINALLDTVKVELIAGTTGTVDGSGISIKGNTTSSLYGVKITNSTVSTPGAGAPSLNGVFVTNATAVAIDRTNTFNLKAGKTAVVLSDNCVKPRVSEYYTMLGAATNVLTITGTGTTQPSSGDALWLDPADSTNPFSPAVLKVAAAQVQVNTGTRPVCDASRRGTIQPRNPGGGVDDIVDICIQKADGSYQWQKLTLTADP